jgi:hypothetical protein
MEAATAAPTTAAGVALMTIDVWREIATGLAGEALSAGVVALEAAAAPGLVGEAAADAAAQ